jgi:phosphatidylserine/phosphatidylglycerophosphate/cardiolipin synthase-like enzyme
MYSITCIITIWWAGCSPTNSSRRLIGVSRVRLLVDDMDMGGRDMGAVAMDRHPNMEVRLFNPFSRNVNRLSQLLTRMGSVTRRMHNKSFTVDNQIAILGGRNIGNEYFDADPDLAFADLDVMAIGPVVKQVSSAFRPVLEQRAGLPGHPRCGVSR